MVHDVRAISGISAREIKAVVHDRPMGRSLVISFDLDGTLLCAENVELADQGLLSLMGPFDCREDRLRLGALPLLKGLSDEGHRIWIYTQSLRGRGEVTGWFSDMGVVLSGYVNLPLHEIACEQHGVVGRRPRKCPHWFDIDVHVDDDEEVANECRNAGCRVILINPKEVDFEDSVRLGLASLDEH